MSYKLKFNDNKVFYVALLCFLTLIPLLYQLGNKFVTNPSTTNLFLVMYGGFAELGFFLYIILYRKVSPNQKLKNFNFDVNKIPTILFLITIIGILLVLNRSVYTKPLEYYVLISIAGALIALQIIGNEETTKKAAYKILLQILILAAVIRLSSFLINPYLFGPDSYWHFNSVSEVLDKGHLLKRTGHYYYYPFFHLLVSSSETIIAFSEKIYSLTSLSLSFIALLIFYLLCREIINERVGLVATLLLTFSAFHIFASINYQPMLNGFTFILMSFYILIKFYKSTGIGEYVRTFVVFWLAALFVFFIHPVASMGLGLILCAYFVVRHLIFKEEKKGITPFYSYSIGFVAYLMFVHYSLFVEIVEALFIPGEASPIPAVEFGVKPTTLLLLESALSFLGPTVLVLFGVYGGLKLVEKMSPAIMALFVSVIFLYFIPLLSYLEESGGLDPGRLVSFIEGFIAIPAGFGLIYLSSLVTHRITKFVLFSSFFVFIAFFSTFSYITWDGNTIFKEEVEVPVGFATQSTLATYPFLSKLSGEKPLYMDDRTNLYINNEKRGFFSLNNVKTAGISFPVLEGDGIFVVNFPVLDRRVWKGEKDEKKFLDQLNDANKIYDSESVIVFDR